jgi:hypothetical protein
MQETQPKTESIKPYEAPRLAVLGTVHELTLHRCFFDKQLGGTDGFTWMGINVPISDCSA